MYIERQITISRSADEVWASVGQNFGQISDWAAGVTSSRMKNPDAELQGNTRICDVPGMGTLVEDIDTADHTTRRLGYAIKGMPAMVARCYNTMEVRPHTPTSSKVLITWDITSKGVAGAMMKPMMKMQLGSATNKLLQEMKTYLETGTPHKRKLKAMKRQKRAA